MGVGSDSGALLLGAYLAEFELTHSNGRSRML